MAIKSLIHFVLSKTVKTGKLTDNRWNKILVNVSAGIGDAIMAEPMIRTLRTHHPEAYIVLICNEATLPLFTHHPSVDDVLPLKSGWMRRLALVKRLRRERFDMFIGTVPSNTLRHVLLPFFAAVPARIKHESPHRGRQNFDFLFHHIEKLDAKRHRVLCNLDLLNKSPQPATPPRIEVGKDVQQTVVDRLTNSGWSKTNHLIGMHAGCNPAAIEKRWRPERFAHVARWLNESTGADILLVGGPDEMAENRTIESLLSRPALNTVGKMNLMETAAAIRLCTFFVTNDSGLMHLATAVGVPTFAIFGPKDERHVGPYGHTHTVIRRGPRVDDVEVDDVMKALETNPCGIKKLKEPRSNHA